MEDILIECVQTNLRNMMYRNSIFMCERLCAQFPTEMNLQLLAGCYLQNNQAYAAYHILKGTKTAHSRYLFAMSCFQMDLLKEAETALCPIDDPNAEVPSGAAGHYLLGLIYRYTDRRENAMHHFKQALSIDPLLWVAYEELCIIGAAEEAADMFGEAAAACIQKQHSSHGIASQNLLSFNDDHNLVSTSNVGPDEGSPNNLKHTITHGNNLRDVPASYQGAFMSSASVTQSLNNGISSISFYNTPSPMATQLSGVAPPPLCRNMHPYIPSIPSLLIADGSPKSTVKSTIQAPKRKIVDESKLRKISGRLFSDSGIRQRRSPRLVEAGVNTNTGPAVATGNGNKQPSKNVAGSKLSSMSFRSITVRKGQPWSNENCDEGNLRQESIDDSRTNANTTTSTSSSYGDTRYIQQERTSISIGGSIMTSSKISTGASELLGLLKIFGEGYRLSCLYRCQDALDVYLKLPHEHYNTSWVLSQVGKAYFELVDYLQACRAFSLARQASPYSLEGMDIYSTVLYHLKEDMKLSYLAQELISTDCLAPQSWCAMGNCYSMQKDHETALKNFQRAVQLNSRFAYGHTLCGHEYVALEDFENGIKSYESALRTDARHYNSWYGLGMIYLRQEKFEFSEHNFRMAFQINPRSSVIMSYLGTALHTLQRSDEALEMMEKAVLADKKNPLPMYQKASILVSMERLDEALDVLEELKQYAPRESSVYALMGKIYKRRHNYNKAMLHFGIALDLKPSATDVATIKAAIEKLHVPDEIEDNL